MCEAKLRGLREAQFAEGEREPRPLVGVTLGPESKERTRCEVSRGAASRVVRRRDELWLEVGSTGIARPSGVASGGALNCSSHAARRARLMCSRDVRASCSTYIALAATEKL